MAQFPWPDGLDIAQATFFATPPPGGKFAPNVSVLLRTDAGNRTPGELADYELSQLRDSGAAMTELDRKIEADGKSARVEYVFSNAGGEKLRQIVWYFLRTAGVYTINATSLAAAPPDAMRAAAKTLFDALAPRS